MKRILRPALLLLNPYIATILAVDKRFGGEEGGESKRQETKIASPSRNAPLSKAYPHFWNVRNWLRISRLLHSRDRRPNSTQGKGSENPGGIQKAPC